MSKLEHVAAVAYWRNLGVTIAAIYHEDEIYIGCSLKSPKDSYAKLTGKKYAIRRAIYHALQIECNHSGRFIFDWNNEPRLWMLQITTIILRKMRTFDNGLNRSSPIDAWRPDYDDGIRVMNLVRQAILRSGKKDGVPTLEEFRPKRKERVEKIHNELIKEMEEIKEATLGMKIPMRVICSRCGGWKDAIDIQDNKCPSCYGTLPDESPLYGDGVEKGRTWGDLIKGN